MTLRPLLLIALMGTSTALQAALDVLVEPRNARVKSNIEVFVGELKADNRRDMWRQARHAVRQAEQAAQALGYYNTQVRPRVAGSDGAPVLQLTVTLGEPTRLDQVDINFEGPGAGTEAFDLPPGTRLRQGAILHHGHYESYKTLVANQALRYGYFSGHFTRQRIEVDSQRNRANLELLYQTGERYRLGDVVFSETPFSERLLQRMVGFESGAPYDSDQIAALNRDLLNTGYFESVQVSAPARQAVDGVIPVQAMLVARKPHSLGFGGGFSTDVGPRVRANWTQHWLNPEGHSRGAEFELSAPRQKVSTWYQLPLNPPHISSLRFFTGLLNEDIDDTESRALTLGAQQQKRLGSGWERVIGLRYEQERFSLGNTSGRSHLLIPSVAFQRTRSSGGVDPSHGHTLLLEVQGAKEGVISDFDFVRANLAAKFLHTLHERHRLLARGNVGGIASNSFAKVPPSLRFFAGGDQSVRGYDYRTLSPTDSSGERVGGRYLMAGSLEYQYEFKPGWRAAGFVDHGNAVDSLLDARKTSLGVGFRWVSPVGPIRVDLARSLSDADEGFRIHFSMGPEL